jgi:predicted acylesterase/phospholipase RssA
MIPKFNKLILSSGSLYTSAFLGCVKYLHDMEALEHIHTIIGTSAGAVLGLLLTIGMTPDEIYKFMLDHVVEKTLTKIDISSIIKLTSSFGLDDGEGIIAAFHIALETKGYDKNTTMVELAKRSGKNLIICVSNITKGCAEYISVDTEPDIPVVLALRMSCAIPLVFEPVEYNDNLYLDGAVTDKCPYGIVDSKLNDTLCIAANFKYPEFKVTDDTNVWDFMYQVFSIFRETHCQLPKGSDKYTIVTVDFDMYNDVDVNPEKMNLTVTRKEFDSHIERGYKAIKDHFKR